MEGWGRLSCVAGTRRVLAFRNADDIWSPSRECGRLRLMMRRIAVVLLLVLALAQGSALACAVHCAGMRRAQADGCCAAMQPSRAVVQSKDRVASGSARHSIVPLRKLCSEEMLSAAWRKARPVPQQHARLLAASSPAPCACPFVSRLADRRQGREARLVGARSIPLRI